MNNLEFLEKLIGGPNQSLLVVMHWVHLELLGEDLYFLQHLIAILKAYQIGLQEINQQQLLEAKCLTQTLKYTMMEEASILHHLQSLKAFLANFADSDTRMFVVL